MYMGIIIEFIAHLNDNNFGILEVIYVFYAEYYKVFIIYNEYISSTETLSCSSRNNSIVEIPHHQQKFYYFPFIKMIFNLIC